MFVLHKFNVTVREVFVKTVEIEAANEEDAKARVNAGKGDVIEGPRFLVQLNPDHWDVQLSV
jgi:hypothetical protein